MRRLNAFSLTELLVVIATMSVMAAMLFPVFAAGKAAAVKTACMSHFKSVAQGYLLYSDDYNQYAIPVNYTPGETPNSKTDRTWVQLMLPYALNFTIFQCPADSSNWQEMEATFDQDLVPGDLYSEFYTASLRSNAGYNFQYLAPIVMEAGAWTAEPRDLNTIVDPSLMLLFADSAWQVTNGVPSGGGSWLVSPPCRYAVQDGRQVDTIVAPVSGVSKFGSHTLFAPTVGWGADENSPDQYGGVWPWHQGRTNICRIDGGAQSLTMAQVSSGCDVQPAWTGKIYNRAAYIWSPG